MNKNANELFDFIDEKKATRLIVDLRFNGGGDFKKGRRLLIERIKENPQINQKGNLFVITGRRTFSAAMVNSIDFKKETNAYFIAAPVVIDYKNSFLQIFQALDFLVLQGITAASVQKRIHNMCNGANLAYERKTFYDVSGFGGIDNIASGDDMLLMQKISRRFPGKLFYMLAKNAIVTTQAAKTWKEFFNQRIRWASKATHYNDIKILSALMLVYFFNLGLFVLFITGFWFHYLWLGFASIVLAKAIIEFVFIYPVAKFFEKTGLLKWFLLFQPVHILYTVIAGWLGRFGSFEWKGRRVK